MKGGCSMNGELGEPWGSLGEGRLAHCLSVCFGDRGASPPIWISPIAD